MSASEDEKEINIEYWQPFEVDPLRESNQKETPKGIVVSPDINDKMNKEPLIATHWYKQVNYLGKYVCSFCEQTYTTIQALRNHVKHQHPQKHSEIKNITKTRMRKKKLKCHLCGMMNFLKIIELKDHFQNQHGHFQNQHGLKYFQQSCFICLATFDGQVELLDHLKSKHGMSNGMRYFCSICGYVTSKLSHFRVHENTHTLKNQLRCHHCDYSTSIASNLKIHERIHNDDKPYVCDYEECGYRCKSRSALTSHQLKHDKKKNMLYCEMCIYSTVYKQSLKRHIESHSRNSVWKRL